MAEEEDWIRKQRKVFTRYMNVYLNKRQINLTENDMICGGLDDGVALWNVTEELSGKSLKKIRPSARLKIQRIENLNVSFDFYHADGLSLVGIGAEDILDHNQKLILGLIWQLILFYQIKPQKEKAALARQKKAAQKKKRKAERKLQLEDTLKSPNPQDNTDPIIPASTTPVTETPAVEVIKEAIQSTNPQPVPITSVAVPSDPKTVPVTPQPVPSTVQIPTVPDPTADAIDSDDDSDPDDDEPYDSSPQAEFIYWLNTVGILVKNITTDFRDGKNLVKLINLLEPNLIAASDEDVFTVVSKVIRIARQKFAIPEILDPPDIIDNPNNLVNLTYFSFFREKYIQNMLKETEEIVLPQAPKIELTPKNVKPEPKIDSMTNNKCPICGKIQESNDAEHKKHIERVSSLEKELETLKKSSTDDQKKTKENEDLKKELETLKKSSADDQTKTKENEDLKKELEELKKSSESGHLKKINEIEDLKKEINYLKKSSTDDQKKTKENDDLKKELETLKKSSADDQKKIKVNEDLKKELEELKKSSESGHLKKVNELEDLKKELEALKKELEALKKSKEIDEMKKTKEIEDLKKTKEIEDLKKNKEIEDLKKAKELDDWKKSKELEELKKAKELDDNNKIKEIEELKKSKLKLKEKLASQEEQTKSLTTNLAKHQTDIIQLNQETDKLNQKNRYDLDSFQQKYDIKIQELTSLAKLKENSDARITELENQMETKNHEILQLIKEKENIKIEQLQSMLSTKSQEVDILAQVKADLGIKDTKISELMSQLHCKTQEVTELSKANDKLKQDLKTNDSLGELKSQEATDLLKEREQLKIELKTQSDQLHSQIESKSKEIENLAKEKDQLIKLNKKLKKGDAAVPKLQSQLTEKAQQVETLSKQVEELNNANIQLRSQLDKSVDDYKTLNIQLEAKNQELENTNKAKTKSNQKLKQKQNKIDDLETQLAQKLEEISKLTQSNQKLKNKTSKLSDLQTQLDEKAQTLENLSKTQKKQKNTESKLRELQTQIDEQNQSIDKLNLINERLKEKEIRLELLEPQLEEKTQQILSLTKLNERLKRKQSEISNKLDNQIEGKDQAENVITKTQSKLSQYKAKIDDLKVQLETKNQQIETLSQNLPRTKELENKLHETEDELQRIFKSQDRLKAQSSEVDKLVQQLEEKSNEVLTLTKENEKLQQQKPNTKLQNHLEEKKREVYKLNDLQLKTNKELKQYQSDIEDLQNQLRTKSIEINKNVTTDENQRNAEPSDKNQRTTEPSDKLKKQLQEKDKHIHKLDKKIQDCEKTIKDQENMIQKLKKQIDKLENHLTEAEEKQNDLTQDIKSLEKSQSSLQKKLRKKEDTIKELETYLSEDQKKLRQDKLQSKMNEKAMKEEEKIRRKKEEENIQRQESRDKFKRAEEKKQKKEEEKSARKSKKEEEKLLKKKEDERKIMEKLRRKDEKIRALNAAADKLQDERRKLRNENRKRREYKIKVIELKKQLEIDRLKEELNNVKKNAKLSKTNTDNAEISRLKQEIGSLQKQIDVEKDVHEKFLIEKAEQDKCRELEKRKLEMQLDCCSNTKLELEKQIQEESKAKEDEINALNEAKQKLEDKIKQESQLVETLKSEEKNEMKKNIEQFQKDLQDLKNKMELEIKQRDSGIQILREELKNIQHQQKVKQEKVEVIKKREEDKASKRQQKRLQNADKDRIKELVGQLLISELDKLVKDKENKEQEINQEKSQMKKLQSEVISLNKEIEEKNKSLEYKDVIIDQKDELIKYHNDIKQRIETENVKKEKLSQKLKKENSKLKKQISEIQTQLVEAENTEQKNLLEKLIEQQANLQKSLDSVELNEKLHLLMQTEESIRKFMESHPESPKESQSSISTVNSPKEIPSPNESQSPVTSPKDSRTDPPPPKYVPTSPSTVSLTMSSVPFMLTKYTEEIKKAEALRSYRESALNSLIREREEKVKTMATETEKLDQEIAKLTQRSKIALESQEKDSAITKNKALSKVERKDARHRMKERTVLFVELDDQIPSLEHKRSKLIKEGEKAIKKLDNEIERLKEQMEKEKLIYDRMTEKDLLKRQKSFKKVKRQSVHKPTLGTITSTSPGLTSQGSSSSLDSGMGLGQLGGISGIGITSSVFSALLTTTDESIQFCKNFKLNISYNDKTYPLELELDSIDSLKKKISIKFSIKEFTIEYENSEWVGYEELISFDQLENDMKLRVIGFPSLNWQFSSTLLESKGWRSQGASILPYKTYHIIQDGLIKDKAEASVFNNILKKTSADKIGKLVDVVALRNESLERAFMFYNYSLMEKFKSSPQLFKKTTWQNKPDVEDRKWVMDQCNRNFKKFNDYSDDPEVPIIPMFQGTAQSTCFKIAQTGFTTVATVDDGFYGRGIYFTSSMEYAAYYSKLAMKGKTDLIYTILAFVSPGNVYPVTETPLDKNNSLRGKAGVVSTGYQSHYVCVHGVGQTKIGFPCPSKTKEHVDEMVIFQDSQAIPKYIIAYEPFKDD